MTTPNTVEAIRERRAKITPCCDGEECERDVEDRDYSCERRDMCDDIDYLLSENDRLKAEVERLNGWIATMGRTVSDAADEINALDRGLRDTIKADIANARRAALLEADELVGLLWVDLANTGLADARHAKVFDLRRSQLRALAQQQGEGITKEWCLNAAKREAENGDSEVGAGFVARDPEPPPDEAPP